MWVLLRIVCGICHLKLSRFSSWTCHPGRRQIFYNPSSEAEKSVSEDLCIMKATRLRKCVFQWFQVDSYCQDEAAGYSLFCT